MTSKPVVVEEANVKELVETNQILSNVNNLLETQESQLINLSFQRTQYYPQDSDLLIYLSCQMCFLCWRIQIAL